MAKRLATQADVTDVVFGRTAMGQLLYDLGFTKLTDKWLARKHRKPISKIRSMRVAVKAALSRQ